MGTDASQARNAAVDAEARADEASTLTDRLLAEHYNEWVPHWVAFGYETVGLCLRFFENSSRVLTSEHIWRCILTFSHSVATSTVRFAYYC